MSGNYRRIAHAVFGSLWAILPERLEAIVELVELKVRGEAKFSPEEIEARIGRPAGSPVVAAAASSGKANGGAVGVLPLYGIVGQRMNQVNDISGPGGTSTEKFTRDLRAMIADPGIKAIVLDVDSPGGTVYGVEELASEIYHARAQKPVVAQVNSLAASAAYWIASAAEEIVVTPSGEVGSIGVYAAHTDLSKLYDNEGVKVTLISAGKHKVDGNPYEPLSEEARAAMQARIDDYYEAFVGAVARGRGTTRAAVRDGFGEGRVVGASEAVGLGMADRIGTLDQTITRVMRGRAGTARAMADADMDPIQLAAERLDIARRRQALMELSQ